MKTLSAMLVVTIAIVACGGNTTGSDQTGDTGSPTELTAAEREWCSFPDGSDESALRFDLIFEAGLALGLPVDEMNAQASELRAEYESSGMDLDAATRAVSADLLEEEVFITACKLAFSNTVGG